MDRLTERMIFGEVKCPIQETEGEYCDKYDSMCFSKCELYKMLAKLATYEDSEESGELVRVVRCKDCTRGTPVVQGMLTMCNLGIMENDDYCKRGERKKTE